MSERIIGVDPGTRVVGYGIIDCVGNKMSLVTCGVINVSKLKTIPEKLGEISRELTEIVSKHKPVTGAVEQAFFHKNVRTAIRIGEGRGVAMAALNLGGVEVFEPTPTEIKKAATGNGQASKEQVQEMVRVLLGMSAKTEWLDASDALAGAICCAHRRR